MTLRHRLRAITVVAVLGLVAGVLVSGSAASAATSTTTIELGRRTITGSLGGADYRNALSLKGKRFRWRAIVDHHVMADGLQSFSDGPSQQARSQ